MKKVLALVVFVLLLPFALGGCGDSDMESNDSRQLTGQNWFSITDPMYGRTFRCYESPSDYDFWCYEASNR